MTNIINRSLIIKDIILGSCSTTHLETTGGITLSLHSRQQL